MTSSRCVTPTGPITPITYQDDKLKHQYDYIGGADSIFDDESPGVKKQEIGDKLSASCQRQVTIHKASTRCNTDSGQYLVKISPIHESEPQTNDNISDIVDCNSLPIVGPAIPKTLLALDRVGSSNAINPSRSSMSVQTPTLRRDSSLNYESERTLLHSNTDNITTNQQRKSRPNLSNANNPPVQSARTIGTNGTTEAPYTSTSTTGVRLVSTQSERTLESGFFNSSWYDAWKNQEQERSLRDSFSSTMSGSTFATTDNPKMIKEAYKSQKLEKNRSQVMVEELSSDLEKLHEQVGSYHELLENFEKMRAHKMELEIEIENLKQKFSSETETLKEDKLFWKKRAQDLEEQLMKKELVTTVMEINDDDECDKKDVNKNKTESCDVETDNATTHLQKAVQEKSMEQEIIQLKLELAQSQEKSDWQALQLREMNEQLSCLRTHLPDLQIGHFNDESTTTRQQRQERDKPTSPTNNFQRNPFANIPRRLKRFKGVSSRNDARSSPSRDLEGHDQNCCD